MNDKQALALKHLLLRVLYDYRHAVDARTYRDAVFSLNVRRSDGKYLLSWLSKKKGSRVRIPEDEFNFFSVSDSGDISGKNIGAAERAVAGILGVPLGALTPEERHESVWDKIFIVLLYSAVCALMFCYGGINMRVLGVALLFLGLAECFLGLRFAAPFLFALFPLALNLNMTSLFVAFGGLFCSFMATGRFLRRRLMTVFSLSGVISLYMLFSQNGGMNIPDTSGFVFIIILNMFNILLICRTGVAYVLMPLMLPFIFSGLYMGKYFSAAFAGSILLFMIYLIILPGLSALVRLRKIKRGF